MKHTGKLNLKFFVLFILVVHLKISTISTISAFNIKNLAHAEIKNFKTSHKASRSVSESLSNSSSSSATSNSQVQVVKPDTFISSNQLKTILPNRNKALNKGLLINVSEENFFYQKVHLKTNSVHLNQLNNIESSYWEYLYITNEAGWSQTLGSFHTHPDFNYSFDTSNFSSNSLSKLKITLSIPCIRWFLRNGRKNAHLYIRLVFDGAIIDTRQFEGTRVNANENLDGNDHGLKNSSAKLNGVVFNVQPGVHKLSIEFSSSLDMLVGLKPNNWPQLTLNGQFKKTDKRNKTLLVPNCLWKRKLNLPMSFYSIYKYRVYVNNSYFFFYHPWQDYSADYYFLAINNGTAFHWGYHDVLILKVAIDDGDEIRLVNHSHNLMMATISVNTEKNRFQYVNTSYGYKEDYITAKNLWQCGYLTNWYIDVKKAIHTNNNPYLWGTRYDRPSYPQTRAVDHNASLISSFNYATGYNHVCKYIVDLKATESRNEEFMAAFTFDGPNASYSYNNFIYIKDVGFSYNTYTSYLGYLWTINKSQTKGYIKRGDKICISINGNSGMYFLGIINYFETINGIDYYRTYKTKNVANWKTEGINPQATAVDYSTTTYWGGTNSYRNFLYINGARYNYINRADVKYCLDWNTVK